MKDSHNTKPWTPRADAPPDYCAKLRGGIERLKAEILARYQNSFPQDWIKRAVAEAEESAWQTPFPSLFFTPLANARITEKQFQTATSRVAVAGALTRLSQRCGHAPDGTRLRRAQKPAPAILTDGGPTGGFFNAERPVLW